MDKKKSLGDSIDTTAPLADLADQIAAWRATAAPGALLKLTIADPESEVAAGAQRDLGFWWQLAAFFQLHIHFPKAGSQPHTLELRLQAPRADDLVHSGTDLETKYGENSAYSAINKLEEPGFCLDLQRALRDVKLSHGESVLCLGVHNGDELALLAQVVGPTLFKSLSLTGVDGCATALARARARFDGARRRMILADLNHFDALKLGRFDLILALNVLHGPGLNGKDLLMNLVRRHRNAGTRIILAFPNCRYLGGRAHYGAKVRNYSEPELSVLIRETFFYRRYLNQHRFRVKVTGKYYWFITALPDRNHRTNGSPKL